MEQEKKTKVLIVDDEEKNLKLMGVLLQSYGYAYIISPQHLRDLRKSYAAAL